MTHPRETHCISKLQNNARTTYARDWTSRTVSTVLAKQFSAAGDIPPSTSQQAICWHLPRKNSPETANPSLKQHPNGFRHTYMANRYAYHHQLLYGQKTQNKWAEPLNPATHCDPILKSITLGPNGYLGIGHPPWKDSWNPILSISLGPGPCFQTKTIGWEWIQRPDLWPLAIGLSLLISSWHTHEAVDIYIYIYLSIYLLYIHRYMIIYLYIYIHIVCI